jgi:hypothetical protein
MNPYCGTTYNMRIRSELAIRPCGGATRGRAQGRPQPVKPGENLDGYGAERSVHEGEIVRVYARNRGVLCPVYEWRIRFDSAAVARCVLPGGREEVAPCIRH